MFIYFTFGLHDMSIFMVSHVLLYDMRILEAWQCILFTGFIASRCKIWDMVFEDDCYSIAEINI